MHWSTIRSTWFCDAWQLNRQISLNLLVRNRNIIVSWNLGPFISSSSWTNLFSCIFFIYMESNEQNVGQINIYKY